MRNYVFGINVDSTKDLDSIGNDIKAFIDKVGAGTAEIQVAIGAQEHAHEEQSSAIGFLSADDAEEYDEEDE